MPWRCRGAATHYIYFYFYLIARVCVSNRIALFVPPSYKRDRIIVARRRLYSSPGSVWPKSTRPLVKAGKRETHVVPSWPHLRDVTHNGITLTIFHNNDVGIEPRE